LFPDALTATISSTVEEFARDIEQRSYEENASVATIDTLWCKK
jgi:hypothetical protein